MLKKECISHDGGIQVTDEDFKAVFLRGIKPYNDIFGM